MLLSKFFLFLIAEFYWAYRVAVDFWLLLPQFQSFIFDFFINCHFLMDRVHRRYCFYCHVIKFNGRWLSKIKKCTVSIGFLSEWEQHLHVLNFTIFARETLTDFYHQKVIQFFLPSTSSFSWVKHEILLHHRTCPLAPLSTSIYKFARIIFIILV